MPHIGAGARNSPRPQNRPAAAAILPAMVEQPVDAPERSLLDAIAEGQLDDHLDALAAAIGARRDLLYTVRSATRLMSFCEGDVVRINQRISPRYLAGSTAWWSTWTTPPPPSSSS